MFIRNKTSCYLKSAMFNNYKTYRTYKSFARKFLSAKILEQRKFFENYDVKIAFLLICFKLFKLNKHRLGKGFL